MNSKALLWKAANKTDDHYRKYAARAKDLKFLPFETLPAQSRHLIYEILQVDPSKRIGLSDILQDQWIKEIEMCSHAHVASDSESHFNHRHCGTGH